MLHHIISHIFSLDPKAHTKAIMYMHKYLLMNWTPLCDLAKEGMMNGIIPLDKDKDDLVGHTMPSCDPVS